MEDSMRIGRMKVCGRCGLEGVVAVVVPDDVSMTIQSIPISELDSIKFSLTAGGVLQPAYLSKFGAQTASRLTCRNFSQSRHAGNFIRQAVQRSQVMLNYLQLTKHPTTTAPVSQTHTSPA